VRCAANDGFADSARGFYYIACGDGPNPPVRVLDRRTGHDRLLITLDAWNGSLFGLSLSPDGTTIYYPKDSSPHSADLLLIENFK
jgi:hypothetical protein